MLSLFCYVEEKNTPRETLAAEFNRRHPERQLVVAHNTVDRMLENFKSPASVLDAPHTDMDAKTHLQRWKKWYWRR